MEITKTSTLTGITRTLDLPVTEQQLINWMNGELIQDAMPNLSPSDREFMITGIVDEEWESQFGANA